MAVAVAARVESAVLTLGKTFLMAVAAAQALQTALQDLCNITVAVVVVGVRQVAAVEGVQAAAQAETLALALAVTARLILAVVVVVATMEARAAQAVQEQKSCES